MKYLTNVIIFFLVTGILSSCVAKKKYLELQKQVSATENSLRVQAQNFKAQLDECNAVANGKYDRFKAQIETCEQEKARLASQLAVSESTLKMAQSKITDLESHNKDLQMQREKQYEQVGDLTVLSQSANANIKETLMQLQQKDQYIQFLQAAKTKADSINLALAVNLTSMLKEGIADKDIEVKVDKTVVFINISDKMLFQSGSSTITPRAGEVLAKIAKMIEARPNLEVMVEGYTDNVPIKNNCLQDNWDLSVHRASSVVRALQLNYGVDPNRMIAAGRGEYNVLASNDTPEGKAMNRRTRIIILPKLDQFYDLLNPNNVPK